MGEFGSVRSRILVLRSVCDDGKLDELSNEHLVQLSDLAVMQIEGKCLTFFLNNNQR